jgi:hypothetical protein
LKSELATHLDHGRIFLENLLGDLLCPLLNINHAIATRYDQLAATFFGMLFIASARYCMKFAYADYSLVGPASKIQHPARAHSADRDRRALAQPDNLVFITEVDSLLVGYAYAEVIHRPKTLFSYADDLVYLHHISVRPS